MVKRKFQPPPVALTFSVLFFALWHLAFWLSPVRDLPLVVTYALEFIPLCAFFFGSSFVCSGAMQMCDGELCINQNNQYFKLLKRLPLKFEGRSLCSISWLGAVLIMFMPVVMALWATMCTLASLVVCFFTGQNVWAFSQEMMKAGQFPYMDTQFTKRGLWKAPGWYCVILSLLGLLVWGVVSLFHNPGFIRVLGVILGGLLVFAVFATLIMLVSMAYIKHIAKDATIVSTSNDPVVEAKYDWAHMASYDSFWEQFMAIFGVLAIFSQVFKQRFCPKIKYVDKDIAAGEGDAVNG
ncbi:MAG: hypothetical protein JSS66_06460 [Armatimonadetes bacterium]|nr:hypothetical protein [Armatimonadota bacterium]